MVYIPVLPNTLYEMLYAPVPYIVGKQIDFNFFIL